MGFGKSDEKPRRSSRKEETPEVIEKPKKSKKSSRKESEEKVVETPRKSSRN